MLMTHVTGFFICTQFFSVIYLHYYYFFRSESLGEYIYIYTVLYLHPYDAYIEMDSYTHIMVLTFLILTSRNKYTYCKKRVARVQLYIHKYYNSYIHSENKNVRAAEKDNLNGLKSLTLIFIRIMTNNLRPYNNITRMYVIYIYIHFFSLNNELYTLCSKGIAVEVTFMKNNSRVIFRDENSLLLSLRPKCYDVKKYIFTF